MSNLTIQHQDLGLEDSDAKLHRTSDSRLFLALVVLSFPVFVLVALERRLAGTLNKDIAGKQKSLLTDAKEYAASTIALVFESR